MTIGRKLAEQFAKQYHRVVRSSISDNLDYPHFCLEASRDPAVFRGFRSDPNYTRILEHVSPQLGLSYLELVRKDDPELLAHVDEFRRNDLYGGPAVSDFPGVGVFSPSTLRYIKVLADLRRIFGPLDGLRICEIGIGYGGQCRIVRSLFQPAVYCLVDLDAVLKLAQTYLDHFEPRTGIEYKGMTELKKSTYDLAISNYAFTELTRRIQDQYLEKVILPATRGYITYNEMTPARYKSYKRDELLKMIPGSRALPETPCTSPKNCIIVWDRSGKRS